MIKHVVTGNKGFIGSKIVEKMSAYSYDIRSGQDILDKKSLEETCKDARGIFHCAAKISVPESFAKPDEYHRVNVLGTQNVIDAAKKVGAKIVFSSSAAVYGDSNVPVSESSPLNPKSPYAQNKKAAEDLFYKSEMSSVVLRYFNVYGPGQSPEYAAVITTFITRALRNEDLIINGDGTQIRDFIYVDDVVEANIAAMNYSSSKFEIFNVASGTGTSIKELAEEIIRLTKSKSKIVYGSARQGDILFSRADISKADNILDWRPKISLSEGLKMTIDSFS